MTLNSKQFFLKNKNDNYCFDVRIKISNYLMILWMTRTDLKIPELACIHVPSLFHYNIFYSIFENTEFLLLLIFWEHRKTCQNKLESLKCHRHFIVYCDHLFRWNSVSLTQMYWYTCWIMPEKSKNRSAELQFIVSLLSFWGKWFNNVTA